MKPVWKKKPFMMLAAVAAAAAMLMGGAGGVTEARYSTPEQPLGSGLSVTTDEAAVTTSTDSTTFRNNSVMSRPGVVVRNEADTGDLTVKFNMVVRVPQELSGMRNTLFYNMGNYGMTYRVYATTDLSARSCFGVENRSDSQAVTAPYYSMDVRGGVQRDVPVSPTSGPVTGDPSYDFGTFNLKPNAGLKFCPVVSEPTNTSASAMQAMFLEHLADAMTTEFSFTSAVPGTQPLTASPKPGLDDLQWSMSTVGRATNALNVPSIQPQDGTDGVSGFDNYKWTARYDTVKWRWPTSLSVDGRNPAVTVYGIQVLYRPSGTPQPFRTLRGYINSSSSYTRVANTVDGIYRPESYNSNWYRGAAGLHFANWSDLGTLQSSTSNRWTYGLDITFRYRIAGPNGANSGYYFDAPFYYSTWQTFNAQTPSTYFNEVAQGYTVHRIAADSNLPAYFDGWGYVK